MNVWEATLDDRYECQVIRTEDPYKGILLIHDGTREILREEVGLSYAAQFGPDVDDVQLWQDMCIQAVDKDNESN